MWSRGAQSYLLAITLAVSLLPVILLVAAVVLVADGRPVLFRARRVGRHGREFDMFKFRTMKVRPVEQRGHLITMANDPRVTSVGAWLRRYRLDELPQLLNVFRGEIRLVGPRPESPEYVRRYGSQRDAMLDLCPGITDPGTLAFLLLETSIVSSADDPSEAYVRDVMPRRNRISIEYAGRATVLTDLAVILQTGAAIMSEKFTRRIQNHHLGGTRDELPESRLLG